MFCKNMIVEFKRGEGGERERETERKKERERKGERLYCKYLTNILPRWEKQVGHKELGAR